MSSQPITTVDQYIANHSAPTQKILQKIRKEIKAAVPDTTEVISYGIPTYRLHGKNMLHFGAYTGHIGLYATPDGHSQFEARLNKYRRGKGSVQFPLNEPIPYELIADIAVYRAQQLNKGAK